MPGRRGLFASTFLLSLLLELFGTWLGNWTWVREVPGVPLVTTNPPVAAGAFYCMLDALVVAGARQCERLARGQALAGFRYMRARSS
jgi:hypothetical protein